MTAAGRYLQFRVKVSNRPGHLARLLADCAAVDANVLEVEHIRTGTTITVDEVEIGLQLETKGKQHCHDVLSALRGKGYQLKLRACHWLGLSVLPISPRQEGNSEAMRSTAGPGRRRTPAKQRRYQCRPNGNGAPCGLGGLAGTRRFARRAICVPLDAQTPDGVTLQVQSHVHACCHLGSMKCRCARAPSPAPASAVR